MSTSASITKPLPTRLAGGMVAWGIGPAFVILAAWLFYAAPHAEIPTVPQPLVARGSFVPGARRQPMGEPPAAVIGGYKHSCNECHRLFDSPPLERRTLTQHTAIRFSHGMNNRCFNCHDRENRERLVLQDGTLIGFDEVPRLCSQCHGTLFRDWQLGMHGKTMGSWDADSGEQVRLNCNDCHDPHAPAYEQFVPLPPPHTLRMGDQSHVPAHHERHIPLRRWSLPESEPAAPEAENPPPAPHQEGHP